MSTSGAARPTLWGTRRADAELAYSTLNSDEAMAVLERYDVEYVYVGNLEREQYGEAGLSKFAKFMVIAYENPDVTIYRMPETTAQVAAADSPE